MTDSSARADPEEHPAVPPGLRHKLILTYANNTLTDGVGAQLQRIYGIYSISRLLGASYLHSPLRYVDYQGFAAWQADVSDPGFHQEFNDLFQITSDDLPSDDFHEVDLPNISIEMVHQLVAMYDNNETGGRPCLARLVVPYGIADSFPDCYEVCKGISPLTSPGRAGRALRVAVHVRRGDLLVVGSDRMLPNHYYITVAQQVTRLLEALEIDYRIELWTEVPNNEFIVHPGHDGIVGRIDAPVVVSPEMCRLEEFSVLPNLLHCINGRAIDCIRELATADILVMSRSSLSYLCAILNRTGIVLYHPFWHRAPSSWMTVGPGGNFDHAQLRNAVRTLEDSGDR